MDPVLLELAWTVKERLSLVTVGDAKQLYFTDLHSISRHRVIPAATVPLIIDMHHGNMMVGHWCGYYSTPFTETLLVAEDGGRRGAVRYLL
jgi:hypothetical protein